MPRPRVPAALSIVAAEIVACERCPRLREYCAIVARDKRAAYRDDEYWGKPVPGFGDPQARLLVLGLAPAAHGANRTGRLFTGDGVGGSGGFLISALHRAGFANQSMSQTSDDGLLLSDAYISATTRCAPPDNRPTPVEIANCSVHLDAEIAALPTLRIVIALGQIAWEAWFQHLGRRGIVIRPRPRFAHGATFEASGAPTLIGAFHPSRQNTNTGRLTPPMYDEVLAEVKRRLRRRS